MKYLFVYYKIFYKEFTAKHLYLQRFEIKIF